MERTIKRIQEEFGITRRMIQRYGEAGLVQPTGKTKQGYLLYDEAAIERILLVKFYSDIGFQIKGEIGAVIEAPVSLKKEMLEKKLLKLQKEAQRQEALIRQTEAVIRTLQDETTA